MAAPAPLEVATIHNETTGTQSRYTKAGQKITYTLTVVQQPERARACGQGAKSSSDRRPVDPPPIIELSMSEGEDAARDITFMHNASLFLYATLENARPIAQGRVQPPAAPNAPVLTGSPVTGINYLERPKAAGYFIFPDLSVRHEGKYRLSFTLFEEMKLPQDMDADASQSEMVASHVYPRCVVKSKPFDVYSAKKFPGLMESTMLSRTVADQGCRVRIRRDVRVRRRESKQDKDWGEFAQPANATNVNTEKRATGPDADPPERPPTSSNQPSQPVAPPSAAPGLPYQQHAYGYHMPQGATHPSYPQNNSHEHNPPAPQSQHLPQSYAQQPYPTGPYMPPPSAQYSFAQYPGNPPSYFPSYAPATAPMMQPPAYAYNGHQQQYQHPGAAHYGAQQPYVDMRGDGTALQSPYSLPNGQQGFPAQMPVNAPYTSLEPHPTSQPNERPLPPLKVSETDKGRRTSHTSPTAATSAGRSTAIAPGVVDAHKDSTPRFKTQPQAGQGAKRMYSSTFSTQNIETPLRSGARPLYADGVEEADGSEEDLQDWNDLQVQYRRADGSYTQLDRHRM